MTDWRTQTDDLGNVYEFVECDWAPDHPDQAPGTINLRVLVKRNGEPVERVVTLTSEQIEAGLS